jgi:hypothetical protein
LRCAALLWPSPVTPSQRQEQTSFRFLRFLRLAQPNSRTSSILFDELDTGGFERSLYYIQCRAAWLTCAAFKLVNGNSSDTGTSG